MGLFHKRPLALGALLFILAGATAFYSRANLWTLAAAALILLILGALSLIIKRPRLIPILLIITILPCLGFIRSYMYKSASDTLTENFCGKTSLVELTVTSRIFSSVYRTSYEATVTKINSKDTRADIIFSVLYEDGLSPGAAISATVTFSELSDKSEVFNEKLYYNSKGIYMTAEEVEDTEYTVIEKSSDTNRFKILVNKLRTQFTTLLNKNLPSKNGLPSAVFLGDRSGLTDFDKLNFNRTGTYHILALSGMHLSILAGILNFFLTVITVKKGLRITVCTVAIIFYVILTGFSLSVVRAAIMLLISYAAYFLRRQNDAVTSLLLAGAAICAVSPNAILDVGFILSMSTTFGIVAFYPSIEAKIIKARASNILGKTVYYILSSVAMSILALMTSLPVSWLYFGRVSVLSPIGTLILSPLISSLLILSPLLMIFGSVPVIGAALGHITVWISDISCYIAELLASPDKIELSLDYPFTPFFLIPFFFLIAVIILLKLKHLRYYILSAAVIMLSFCMIYSVYIPCTPISTSFVCLDENEYFIISKGGKNTFIDISDGTYKKLSEAAAQATSRGYCQIDSLILTHYHQRHTSSVTRLISNNPVKQLILSEPINNNELQIMLAIKEKAESQGIETHIFSNSKGFTLFGDTKVTLHRDYISRSTHPIISLTFKGETNISYFGSSYAEARKISEAAENIILGTHGPIPKKEFSIPITDQTRLISFADKSIAELLSPSTPKPPEDCTIFINTEKIFIED